MKNLIDEVRQRGGILSTDSAAREAVDTVVSAIKDVTARGDKVVIREFGTFAVKDRAARQARNPQTGEPITISARKQLTFKSRS